ncbi:hypothetical protein, partial [Serratia marcescens]
MDLRTRYDDFDEMLATITDAVKAGIWVAMPVKVAADSKDGHTISLQPSVKATKLKPDGTRELTQLPVLSDCP